MEGLCQAISQAVKIRRKHEREIETELDRDGDRRDVEREKVGWAGEKQALEGVSMIAMMLYTYGVWS